MISYKIFLESIVSKGWHVTKKENENDIYEFGIKARKGTRIRFGRKENIPNDVYVWGNINMAEWFKNLKEQEGEKYIIMEIDLNGLQLREDPETEDMSDYSSNFEKGEKGEGYIVNKTITPDRILRTI